MHPWPCNTWHGAVLLLSGLLHAEDTPLLCDLWCACGFARQVELQRKLLQQFEAREQQRKVRQLHVVARPDMSCHDTRLFAQSAQSLHSVLHTFRTVSACWYAIMHASIFISITLHTTWRYASTGVSCTALVVVQIHQYPLCCFKISLDSVLHVTRMVKLHVNLHGLNANLCANLSGSRAA